MRHATIIASRPTAARNEAGPAPVIVNPDGEDARTHQSKIAVRRTVTAPPGVATCSVAYRGGRGGRL
jgi:hypothetical protein